MVQEVCLCVGSNCGDREGNVSNALLWLESLLSGSRHSNTYETPEIHGCGNPYFNAVISGKIDKTIEDFEKELKEYEVRNGRDISARQRGDVPIDIDIVVCNGNILRPKDYSHSFFKIGYSQIK